MISAGIVKIPILVDLNMLLACDQVVARRNLENPIEQRAHLMSANFEGVINGFGIPAGWHSRRK